MGRHLRKNTFQSQKRLGPKFVRGIDFYLAEAEEAWDKNADRDRKKENPRENQTSMGTPIDWEKYAENP